MITVHFIPAGKEPFARAPVDLQCKTGQSLMQAAVAANVPGIDADCGGMMTCGTCHVYVCEPHASRLPPAGGEEDGMLEFTAAPRRPNSRLSCQIPLEDALDGLTAELPDCQH